MNALDLPLFALVDGRLSKAVGACDSSPVRTMRHSLAGETAWRPPTGPPAPARAARLFPARSRIAAMLQNSMKTYHVSVQSRGTIALPADLRRRLHLDEPGAQVRIIEREDGSIELQPMLPVPADQAWFWTERWQAMEREADEDIAAGRVSHAMDVEEFLEQLERTRLG